MLDIERPFNLLEIKACYQARQMQNGNHVCVFIHGWVWVLVRLRVLGFFFAVFFNMEVLSCGIKTH